MAVRRAEPRQAGTSIRILLATGSAGTVSALRTALHAQGWQVAAALSGREALASTGPLPPDVVVLDLALPDLDAIAVMRRLRARHPQVPVLFLTEAEAVTTRVAALDAGGDDCLASPFSPEELAARLEALARRARRHVRRAGRTLRVGDLRLDEETGEVIRGSAEIRLTRSEFALLRFLMEQRRVVSFGELLVHAPRGGNAVGWETSATDRALVRKRIFHLRRKVDAGRPAMIHTVRGGGYLLKPPGPEHVG